MTSGIFRHPPRVPVRSHFPIPHPLAFGATFDGAYMKTTSVTGMSDGKQGTVSVWLRRTAGDASLQKILHFEQSGSVRFFVQKQAGGSYQVRGYNSAGTMIYDQTGQTTVASGAWHHLLLAWDLADGISHMFLNGVNDADPAPTITDDDIDLGLLTDYMLGADVAGANKWQGEMAEIWFDDVFINIGNSNERRKFISDLGTPVELGADGSNPGAQPAIYFQGQRSNIHVNSGEDGNWSKFGTFTFPAKTPGIKGVALEILVPLIPLLRRRESLVTKLPKLFEPQRLIPEISKFPQPLPIAQACRFNGTSIGFDRGAAITGLASGKVGIVSCWFRFRGGDGAAGEFFAMNVGGGVLRFTFLKLSTNKFRIDGRNSSHTQILNIESNTAYTAGATWHHLLASWDLGNGLGEMYIDDADDLAASPVLTDDSIDFSGMTDWHIGYNSSSNWLNAEVSDLFFHDSYLDITTEANRRKFISALGNPIDLGADGSGPLGTSPRIYLRQGFDNFELNAGTGGDFTAVGTAIQADKTPGIKAAAEIANLITKVIAETVQIADAVVRLTGLLRIIDESAQVAESIVNPRTLVRLIAETVQVSEGIIRVRALVRILAETVQVSEGTIVARVMVRVIDETAQVVEGILRALGLVKVKDETVEVSEDKLNLLGIVRSKDETVEVSEARANILGLVRSKDETVQVSEGTLRFLGLARVIDEAAQVSETIVNPRTLVRVLSETVQVSEAIARARVMVRAIAETVQVSEAIIRARAQIRIIAETVQVSEGIIKSITGVVTGALSAVFSIEAAVTGALTITGRTSGTTTTEPSVTGNFTVN